jgi:uncharacterized protein (DUF1330 family)
MLLLTAHLYSHENNIAALRAFEQKALTIIQQYGGELIAAFQPANPGNSANIPDEIQLLKFPSLQALDAYRQSAEAAAIAAERLAAIRKTEIFISQEIVTYTLTTPPEPL